MDNTAPEKIVSVDEIKNCPITEGDENDEDTSWRPQHGDGYRVVTSRRELVFLICNREQCCEGWGHLASEDNLKSFVGANLLEVRLTDPQMKTIVFSDEPCEQRDVNFITLHTDRGPLQFCAYTEHNGYYGHSVYFKNGPANWKDLTEGGN